MGDWIEWNGGEMPVPAKVRVEVKLREPVTGENVAEAICYDWQRLGLRSDIIAYRIVGDA